MNFETGYAEVWAARRNPNVPQASGNVRPVGFQSASAAKSTAGAVDGPVPDGAQVASVDMASVETANASRDEEMSFWDFLDVINPLHHLPLVGDMYRELTGDTIKPSTQVAGGMLFGGPFALVTGVYSAMVEQSSGEGVGGTLVAALTGDDGTGSAPRFSAQPRAASGVMLASLDLSRDAIPGAQSLDEMPVDDGIATGVMVASVEIDGLANAASGPAATDGRAVDGHHALPKTVAGETDDPALTSILLAAADSYASDRSLDTFLTLAAAGPASANPAPASTARDRGTPPVIKAGTAAGSIQFADVPATASQTIPPNTTTLQLAELDDTPAATEQPARQARRLSAEDANPIPLDDARRFNRALPLFAGASSRRDEIKAADVADAANRLNVIRAAEREAAGAHNDRISPAVARSVAPSDPTLAAPAGPAGIQDPFGRSISANNLGDKMLQALDKYRSSSNLGGAGI